MHIHILFVMFIFRNLSIMNITVFAFVQLDYKTQNISILVQKWLPKSGKGRR